MAWRYNGGKWVKEGTLDNRVSGKTVGEIEFAGIGRVALELIGNMEGVLHGKMVRFYNPDYDPNHKLNPSTPYEETPEKYFMGWGNEPINGRVRWISVEEEPNTDLMCIEFWNVHDDTDLELRSVIESVPYKVIE